jgi:putative heme-binding domain-containing protein
MSRHTIPPTLLIALLLAGPVPAADPVPKAPAGFTVEPVIQAPNIEAPTALAVAPNGDVYFAEDPMDMAGPPTKNLDRIWLLKGGDPKKKILFAEHLWAVMGLEIVGDRLYCVHAPYISVFTLDRDGKAAKRDDLFTDLGPKVAGLPSFNDHIPSGIRMGADGWLYVSIGDKGIPKMTRKEKDSGSWHVAEGQWRWSKEGNHISLEGGGVIRFRPDGSGLEVFASGTRNHLDVPLDDHDRIFVRDNTDDGLGWNTRLMYLPKGGFMGYPWVYKRRPKEMLPAIADFGGGSPCGGWVYLDNGLPETYRGRIFHCEWGKGKVFAVKLKPKGAGFEVVDEIKFLDPEGTPVKDFRPFTLRPTADGRGFYVTDWGFSGWSQPKKAGRIFKVTYSGDDVKPLPRGSDTDSVEKLIAALDHPAYSERVRAQRALIARGAEAAGEVEKRLGAGKLSDRATQQALWVIAEAARARTAAPAKDETFGALLAGTAKSADSSVRREAARVLGEYENLVSAAHRVDVKLAGSDPDASVRLYAATTATHRSTRVAVGLLAKEEDLWVRAAVVRALQMGDWKKHLEELKLSGNLPSTGPAREGLFRAFADQFHIGVVGALIGYLDSLDAATRGEAIALLARVYKDRKPYAGTWWGTQPAAQKPPARVVPWEGTPVVRKAILGALADRDETVRRAGIDALVEMNDPETLDPLVKQFAAEKNDATRSDIVRAVAGLSGFEKVPFLSGLLGDGKQPEGIKLEAIRGLEKSNRSDAVQALVRAAAATEPAAVQVRALTALGVLKSPAGRDALTASLKSPTPAIRTAAAAGLGQLGDVNSAASLLPLVKDTDPAVRSAAIVALGVLKARSAIPALVEASHQEVTQFDAIGALTRMPDKRALSAYLSGLGSKNADLRKLSREALTEVREAALPDLEQLVKRGEVAGALLPELRSIYSSYSPILVWNLIGPFPADGKVHPPQTELKPEAVYDLAGKKVTWRVGVKADPRQHGRVNLAGLYGPLDNMVVYGWAEVESSTDRDAELLIGSDDTMVVWVNGKKVFEFTGSRGWAHDQNRVAVKLKKGKNTLLIQCGNHSGPWEFSLAVSGEADRYAFLQGGGRKLDLEDFRTFARKNMGDAKRGEKLFRDVKGLACIKCHAVGGEGGQVGPDLAGVALKYKREDLMTSILEPSKVIAQGYETIVINTVAGRTLTGVFKGETTEEVRLADAEGKVIKVPKKEIDERAFSTVSLMPTGLNEGMTLQDFADLVAYLEARREEPKKK